MAKLVRQAGLCCSVLLALSLVGCGSSSGSHGSSGGVPNNPIVPPSKTGAAPTNLTALLVTNNTVRFNWRQNDIFNTGVLDYLYLRATGPMVSSPLKITLTPSKTNEYDYTVTDLKPGTYSAYVDYPIGNKTSNTVSFTITSQPASTSPIPTSANGIWAYGSSANTSVLDALNAALSTSQKINMIFPYGLSLAFPSKCTANPKTGKHDPNHPNLIGCVLSSTGGSFGGALQAYATAYPHDQMSPIIDGRMDNGYHNTIVGFNALSKGQAEQFADAVATQVCALNSIDGVQFDLEPLSVMTYHQGGSNNEPIGNGSYYFYQEITKDFSGHNSAISDCVDPAHPKGRYFSVFTFAQDVNPALAQVLKYEGVEYGYIVDSLYDLGPLAGGMVNSNASYEALVAAEVSKMFTVASQYGLKFQFALPYGASAHEHTGVYMMTDANGLEEKSTGVNQATYIVNALSAIKAATTTCQQTSGCDASLHVGNDVWAIFPDNTMTWAGTEFSPGQPTDPQM